ncbi:MAG: HRDC domain-containing protein [Planctomycetota bacterium]
MASAPSKGDGSPNTARHADRQRHHRGSFRRAHHKDQHDGDAPKLGPLPDNPRVPTGKAVLIDNDADLIDALGRMRQTDGIAYDTEFIGESSYHPLLCVIQLSTVDEIVLVDPLADIDITPIWELLADAAVRKWVHAGEQDLEPVVRHLGRPAANVLDTQIAAGFCHMAYPVSLAKLTAELLGYRPGKGLTFTDWSERPLSGRQLHYAADDVRFLPAMAAILEQRLADAGHADHAQTEADALCSLDRHRFDLDDATGRVKSAGSLTPAQKCVLRELVAWRDQRSRDNDLPPRAFVKDEVLIYLSRKRKLKVSELSGIKFMPRPVAQDFGDEIVAAWQAGTAEAENAPPPPKIPDEPTPTERFHASAFHAAVAALCHSRGIDPDLVASRQETMKIAHRHLSGRSIDGLPMFNGWRGVAVGESVKGLLDGVDVHISWKP